MYLTSEQEGWLAGSRGELIQRMFEILVAIGDRQQATCMIPIKSAHLSGISYLTGGQGALDFYHQLEDAGLRTTIYTSINPCGFDLQNFRQMNLDEAFVRKQQELLDAMRRIGISITCSCIPQVLANAPKKGDHIAWAESSALSYANSILGAYTNRESGITALISAILGVTSNHGLHIDENRFPTHRILLDSQLKLKTNLDFSLLGGMLGQQLDDGIPFFSNTYPSYSQIKALLAGMATSGQVALAYFNHLGEELSSHVPLTTNSDQVRELETLSIDKNAFERYVERLDHLESEPDLAVFGCPHLTEVEIDQILELTQKDTKLKDKKLEIWFFCPRAFEASCPEKLSALRTLGKVWYDTCMVVSPAVRQYQNIIVDSYKSYRYLRPYFENHIQVKDRLKLIQELFGI